MVRWSILKNLHIVNTDKFVNPYIDFIRKNFSENEHSFICIPETHANIDFKNRSDLLLIENIFDVKFLKELYSADRIYLHSLFNKKLIALLFIHPLLLKKCSWIIWGGDLYSFRRNKIKFKSKLKEFMKKSIIKRFGTIITLVEEDYNLAQKWYQAKGVYFHGAYINPISKKFLEEVPFLSKENKKVVCIQVGNSADPSNNHIQVLNRLKNYSKEDIKIYVPLSYGDKKYSVKVIELGNELFGEKFIPITKFLTPEEYSKYLNTIDIALFNNNRQQALGNIYALLYLNKKVYIRPDTSMSSHFKKMFNVETHNMLDVGNVEFEEFKKEDINENRSKISCVFEEEYLIGIWSNIFKENI